MIVEASRDRAAAGRSVLAGLGAIVLGTVWLMGGVTLPAIRIGVQREAQADAGGEARGGAAQAAGAGQRRVIATGWGGGENRCKVRGYANGAAVTFAIDTGDPNMADFAASFIRQLGLNRDAVEFRELLPGSRYGGYAEVTLQSIRVGDIVWNNPEVGIFSDWRYTFGPDEIPLLGLRALRAKGIAVEFVGDTCRLTMAGTAQPLGGFIPAPAAQR
jgi:hypothetical protein